MAGTNPHPSQGQTGQNGDFTVELKKKKAGFVPGTGPNLSWGGVPFVPGKVPVRPGHRPAETVYVYRFVLALDRFAAYVLAQEIKKFPVKNGPEKGTPKRAQNAFFCFP